MSKETARQTVEDMLLSDKEGKVAQALVGIDAAWQYAVEFDADFQKNIYYLSRLVTRLLDEVAMNAAGKYIEDLDLKVRPYNVLKREGVHTIEELVAHTPWDLLEMRNMGHDALRNIQEQLAERHLKLKGDD